MSRWCPHCKSQDLRVQTMAVFRFDGTSIDDSEMLCDVTENLIMEDFEDNYVSCANCEWEGKVKDLVDASAPVLEPIEVMRLRAILHDELVSRIRDLENALHGIENAIDRYEDEDAAGRYAIFELIKTFLPWDDENEHESWLIEPRCPECGWCLNYRKGSGVVLHCDNPDCTYKRDEKGS